MSLFNLKLFFKIAIAILSGNTVTYDNTSNNDSALKPESTKVTVIDLKGQQENSGKIIYPNVWYQHLSDTINNLINSSQINNAKSYPFSDFANDRNNKIQNKNTSVNYKNSDKMKAGLLTVIGQKIVQDTF